MSTIVIAVVRTITVSIIGNLHSVTSTLGETPCDVHKECGSVVKNSLRISEDVGIAAALSTLRLVVGVHTVLISGAEIPDHSLRVTSRHIGRTPVTTRGPIGPGTVKSDDEKKKENQT